MAALRHGPVGEQRMRRDAEPLDPSRRLYADVSGPLGFRLRHPAWPDAAITARMLLTHTSGLRNGPSYPVPLGHRLSEAFAEGSRHTSRAKFSSKTDGTTTVARRSSNRRASTRRGS